MKLLTVKKLKGANALIHITEPGAKWHAWAPPEENFTLLFELKEVDLAFEITEETT